MWEIKPPFYLLGQAAEFKFHWQSKFEPLPVIWQSLLKLLVRLFQKAAKSMAELLGPRRRSSTTLEGGTGKHKHRAFPSHQRPLLAPTDGPQVLPLRLLQC